MQMAAYSPLTNPSLSYLSSGDAYNGFDPRSGANWAGADKWGPISGSTAHFPFVSVTWRQLGSRDKRAPEIVTNVPLGCRHTDAYLSPGDAYDGFDPPHEPNLSAADN